MISEADLSDIIPAKFVDFFASRRPRAHFLLNHTRSASSTVGTVAFKILKGSPAPNPNQMDLSKFMAPARAVPVSASPASSLPSPAGSNAPKPDIGSLSIELPSSPPRAPNTKLVGPSTPIKPPAQPTPKKGKGGGRRKRIIVEDEESSTMESTPKTHSSTAKSKGRKLFEDQLVKEDQLFDSITTNADDPPEGPTAATLEPVRPIAQDPRISQPLNRAVFGAEDDQTIADLILGLGKFSAQLLADAKEALPIFRDCPFLPYLGSMKFELDPKRVTIVPEMEWSNPWCKSNQKKLSKGIKRTITGTFLAAQFTTLAPIKSETSEQNAELFMHIVNVYQLPRQARQLRDARSSHTHDEVRQQVDDVAASCALHYITALNIIFNLGRISRKRKESAAKRTKIPESSTL